MNSRGPQSPCALSERARHRMSSSEGHGVCCQADGRASADVHYIRCTRQIDEAGVGLNRVPFGLAFTGDDRGAMPG